MTTPRWLSQAVLFQDRFDAGRQLARALPPEIVEGGVVIGLARGGMQVAGEIARVLGAPLDAVAVRKIGHPLQPEYALGAVAPGGDGVYIQTRNGLSDEDLAAVVERTRAATDELDRRLHSERPPVDLRGRPAILVDDGLATGSTMIAAVRWAKSRGAARTIAAVPVAALESSELVRREASAFVCPHVLAGFAAVGLWYEQFPQVSDDEVVALLDELLPGTPAREGTA